MVKEIHILSSDVINQIAAGEVVDRPAHLVKELVENSIDAGATELEVDIENGGRRVSVRDNGHGIAKEQMELALSRHATSKIGRAADLWELNSFGFRGEALASISAVSKLTLVSRSVGCDKAYRLHSEFGKVGEIEKVGARDGTQILVDELFENVPARLKFLKTEAGEVSQIKTALRALGLSHPQVGFRVKINGQLVFSWLPEQSQIERACRILEVEQLYFAHGELNGYQVNIAFAAPNKVFGNSKNIWLFAQARWIQDRSLQAAVMDAYRGLLMSGEFPYVVVWLTIPPSHIDVNVHPTKSHVKFLDQRSVFQLVQRTLRGDLEKAPWLKNVLGESQERTRSGAVVEIRSASLLTGSEEAYTRFRTKDFALTPSQFVRTLSDNYAPTPAVSSADANSEVAKQKWSGLQVLGQANLTYIVSQSDEKIIFIDQHAAHERVVYESLMRSWREGRFEVQQHLIPLMVELDESRVAGVISQRDALLKMGLDVDQAAPNALFIRSSPVVLKDSSVAKAITILAEEILEHGESFAFEKSLSDLFATMACHSVVRAGQALSISEMTALIKDMDEFPLSCFCPHGRPVFVEFPFVQLEREFGRIK